MEQTNKHIVKTFLKQFPHLCHSDNDNETIALRCKTIKQMTKIVNKLNDDYKRVKNTDKSSTIKSILFNVFEYNNDNGEKIEDIINKFVDDNKNTITLNIKYRGFLSDERCICGCDWRDEYDVGHGGMTIEIINNIANNCQQLFLLELYVEQEWITNLNDYQLEYITEGDQLKNNFMIKYDIDIHEITQLFDNENVLYNYDTIYNMMECTINMCDNLFYKDNTHNNDENTIFDTIYNLLRNTNSCLNIFIKSMNKLENSKNIFNYTNFKNNTSTILKN